MIRSPPKPACWKKWTTTRSSSSSRSLRPLHPDVGRRRAAGSITDYPKHYLSQFHPSYVDEAELAQKTQDANFDNWWELFGNKRNWQNPEQPHIWPWLPVRVPPDVPLVNERNPYYFKVDPEGNQLPYLDKMQFDVVENADLLNLKAVAGEIDMQFRHILWTDFPLFVENAEQGDYRVFKMGAG